MLAHKIEELEVSDARAEVERFLVDPATVSAWSRELFSSVADRILIRR
jgi:hypothetical protein